MATRKVSERTHFLIEGELATWIGIPLADFKAILPALEKDGFPLKDPRFADRRYATAVKRWFDSRYRLLMPEPHMISSTVDTSSTMFLSADEAGAKLQLKRPLEVKAAFMVWERSGFPKADPQFGDRYYWAAIEQWLDRQYGIIPRDNPKVWGDPKQMR